MMVGRDHGPRGLGPSPSSWHLDQRPGVTPGGWAWPRFQRLLLLALDARTGLLRLLLLLLMVLECEGLLLLLLWLGKRTRYRGSHLCTTSRWVVASDVTA